MKGFREQTKGQQQDCHGEDTAKESAHLLMGTAFRDSELTVCIGHAAL
jgi:hypothetical protein